LALRWALWVTIIALALTSVALALAETHVIGPVAVRPEARAPSHHHHHGLRTSLHLLEETAAGSATASYTVRAPTYALTIRSNRPSWVEVGQGGDAPDFVGLVQPGQAEHLSFSGPVDVDVGAGGTTVTVSSGRKAVVLAPPVAPFAYHLRPQSGR
jgi:hypothetical protein